ncbi:hypothetical protein VNO78_13239 [Psophocarpus tetragonolobus]|uniref:SKP1-like protein n=1 Tax=Psophocarpus tetragonolobus TaxID=3891 RepID=A0AAN9XQ12_PSOTE
MAEKGESSSKAVEESETETLKIEGSGKGITEHMSQMREHMMKLAIEKAQELKNSVVPAGEEDEMVKLRSMDGVTFEVEASIAKEMETVQSFIEECGRDPSEVIPLHNVSSRELSRIVRYCSEHLRLARDGDIKGTKEFDNRFVAALSLYEMKELVLAANYLNMKKLLDFLSASIAEVIKNKSVEFVREFFGVDNDYTPEEEHQYRSLHAWAFKG